MRYIVTGGAGFTGSNLADTLPQNHDVVIIDNLAAGRRENIEHLLDHPRVTFVETLFRVAISNGKPFHPLWFECGSDDRDIGRKVPD